MFVCHKMCHKIESECACACQHWLSLLIVLGFALNKKCFDTKTKMWFDKFGDSIFWLKNRLRVLLNLISCAFTNSTATYKLNYDFISAGIRMSDFRLMLLLLLLLLFAQTACMYVCVQWCEMWKDILLKHSIRDDDAIFMLLIRWHWCLLCDFFWALMYELNLYWNFMIVVFNKHYVYFCLSVYSNPIVPYAFGVTWCGELLFLER